MDRREVIKLVSLATGSALSAPLISSLLVGCKEAPKESVSNENLHFFSQDDYTLLKTLVDTILPKTDSPSATEVGVHQIIDVMVGTVYSTSAKEHYQKSFKALKAYLGNSSDYLEAFQSLSSSEQETDKEAKNALQNLKQQTIAYYLTTEEVATKHLNYLAIPGKYEPCISLDDVNGKAWAKWR